MKLIHLLPFMDKEELKELAAKIINGEAKGVNLVVLYPFLDRADLDELVDQLLEKQNYKPIYGALPFLGKDKVSQLYDRVQAGELEGFKEQALLPFLGKDKIKAMFDDIVKHATETGEAAADEDVSDLFEDEE